MAESVLLKDLPRNVFEQQMTAQLNSFLADNADFFNANPDKKAALTGSTSTTLDDMYNAVHGTPLSSRNRSADTITWLGPDVDPIQVITGGKRGPEFDCVAAWVPVVVDVLTLGFQALGVFRIARRLAMDLVVVIRGEIAVGLQIDILAFRNATTNWQKAVALAKLGGGIAKLIGLKQILTSLFRNLHWYEWVLMGVVMGAQVLAWFATDGVALAAEIIIGMAMIGNIVADIYNAYNTCHGGTSSETTLDTSTDTENFLFLA